MLSVTLVVLAVPVTLWAWSALGGLAGRTAVLPDPERMDVVVVPHPGDEFQAWSLVEDDPTSYKVFVLTDDGSGRALDAWVDRFGRLGQVDETLPTDLRGLGRRGPFPDDHGAVCRPDDRPAPCRTMRNPRVWVDDDGRGALVAFGVGAGGLTRREVLWTVRTVKRNREALGIEPALRPGSLIGAAFANRGYGCARFTDPDHLAVHEALFHTDLHFTEQLAPTCADDPDASRSSTVSARSTAVFFGHGLRVHGAPATLSRKGQRHPFHTGQTFWVRFGE